MNSKDEKDLLFALKELDNELNASQLEDGGVLNPFLRKTSVAFIEDRARWHHIETTHPVRFSYRVATLGGTSIIIHTHDHDKHFHAVRKGSYDIRVSIETGEFLSAKSGAIKPSEMKKIQKWAIKHRLLLEKTWADKRSTDAEKGYKFPTR